MHAEGAAILQQLYHVGAHADWDNSFEANWSPSGLPSMHDQDGSHAMTEGQILELVEAYGQVRVGHQLTHAPLSTVYVKCYARTRGGQVRFHKDGYTDLRGRFDYASVSTSSLDDVERFALLVLSDEHGALVVRHWEPPGLDTRGERAAF